jgi:NAD(P)-dependent dehydrogenase (short-subunit alcohol dehydrogenase family)
VTTTRMPADTRPGSLAGQTVLVIGGSSGIGLETARQAGDAGAELILTGRDPDRLDRASAQVANARTATVDIGDPASLDRLLAGMATPIDHVLVTGGGPVYAPIADLDLDLAARVLDEHLLGALRISRACRGHVREGGSLTFVTGTDARRPSVGSSVAAIMAAAIPVIVANVALELAPVRANAIAAGFVETPLSARVLGEDLDRRRDELRALLPIRRVVGPADLAALALHLMANTAVTGATFDVDGGQQLLP